MLILIGKQSQRIRIQTYKLSLENARFLHWHCVDQNVLSFEQRLRDDNIYIILIVADLCSVMEVECTILFKVLQVLLNPTGSLLMFVL